MKRKNYGEIVHGVHGRICSKTSGRANYTWKRDLCKSFNPD